MLEVIGNGPDHRRAPIPDRSSGHENLFGTPHTLRSQVVHVEYLNSANYLLIPTKDWSAPETMPGFRFAVAADISHILAVTIRMPHCFALPYGANEWREPRPRCQRPQLSAARRHTDPCKS